MIRRLDTLWESGKWLNFRDKGPVSKGAATRRFEVQSRATGQVLGFVRWWPTWRRYTFEPVGCTVYDAKCLTELAEYCTLKTEQHKGRGIEAPTPENQVVEAVDKQAAL